MTMRILEAVFPGAHRYAQSNGAIKGIAKDTKKKYRKPIKPRPTVRKGARMSSRTAYKP